MKKIYTAIGKLHFKNKTGGTRLPIIISNGEEITLDMSEMVLWSTLYWQFFTEDEVSKQFELKKKVLNFTESRSTESILYWLLQRGIIAEGIGDTYEDALYDLLTELYITPISENPILLMGSFLKMVISDGYSVKEAAKVFRRDSRNDGERTVMKIIRRVRLSVAEVIRCVERGVLDIRNEDEIVEVLYGDDYTTEFNIADEMRSSPVSRDVLSDVANLYLRQQLVFDRT